VGDTNLDPRYIPALVGRGYEHAFSGLQGIFLQDDLTIVNFECAASSIGRPLAKRFTFNCDLDALPVMRSEGVDVANLANNHSRDWGEAALLESIETVREAGMAPVGIGATAQEAHEPAFFDINGWRIAVLGFGGVVPSRAWIATEQHPGMADGDDLETMVAAVEAASAQADLVFVTIHWGVELDTRPRSEDVERAHAMIDAGADGVFGHHPHRLQALEFYDGKPIAWSLGNFVWPRLSRAGSTTAIAQFVVEPDGSITACLIPTIIESSGHPVIQVDYHGHCTWPGHEGAPHPIHQSGHEPR
jgi:poly-gamma-glutamate synthesis protein (capsule biosynthesis protein)